MEENKNSNLETFSCFRFDLLLHNTALHSSTWKMSSENCWIICFKDGLNAFSALYAVGLIVLSFNYCVRMILTLRFHVIL